MLNKNKFAKRLDMSLFFQIFFYLIISIFILLFTVLVFLPYSILERIRIISWLQHFFYQSFLQNNPNADYKQLVTIGTLINAILTNSYENMLKSKNQRIHGFLYSDLHYHIHAFSDFLRFFSIYLIFITMLLYIQEKILRMLFIWIITALITCLLLCLSLYASHTSEPSLFRELNHRLKNDFKSETSSSWKNALSRSMEYTATNPCHSALTVRSDLEFFSLCFINAWAALPSPIECKNRLLLMQYELIFENIERYTRANRKDPHFSYLFELLQCVDGLRDEVYASPVKRTAYCHYLYTIFLFAFIHLTEEKSWDQLVRLVNHAPLMPQWDEDMNTAYTHLTTLATLVCISEGSFNEADFNYINYSVLQTLSYYHDMDLFHIKINPDCDTIRNLYNISWIIYRQCYLKGDI